MATAASLVLFAVVACGGNTSQKGASASSSGTAAESLNPMACGNTQWRAAHEGYCASEDPAAADPVSADEHPDYTWTDTGIKAEITKVIIGPAPSNYHDNAHPDFDTSVTITVQITNTGTTTWTFPTASMYSGGSMTYGVNGYDATGWAGDQDETSLPAHLVARSSATMTEVYTAPADGVAEALTYKFSPDNNPDDPESMQDHVWTDIEKIAGH